MKNQQLVVRNEFGLYVPHAGLYFDARRAPGLVFVSHAHSDHCSSAGRIVCTHETAVFHRQRRRNAGTSIGLTYGQEYPLGSSTLTLLPAGHTLGSAMAAVNTPDGCVVYTGDYKLRPGAFSSGISVPRCDTLVMECTFGEPRYRFPPEDEVIGALCAFIDATLSRGAVPVVLAYAFGKAQEALYHLTARGYSVAVEPGVAELCSAHVDLGFHFPGPGGWRPYTKGRVDDQVLLTTSGGCRSFAQHGQKFRSVHLTGWACGGRARWGRSDYALPLSGHADFDELVRTAKESGARKVYTVHGSPRFAAHLRALGIDAHHLGTARGRGVPPAAARAWHAAPEPHRTTQLSLALA